MPDQYLWVHLVPRTKGTSRTKAGAHLPRSAPLMADYQSSYSMEMSLPV